MIQIKLILLLVMSLTIGFGMWYLFGWFISNEKDLFLWPWWGKILFLWVGLHTTSSIIEGVKNNLE